MLHISSDGFSPPQNAGRSGLPKMRQRLSCPNWTHLTPAGFPFGIPGMGLVIEGAMQHAPQFIRHSIICIPLVDIQLAIGHTRYRARNGRGGAAGSAQWPAGKMFAHVRILPDGEGCTLYLQSLPRPELEDLHHSRPANKQKHPATMPATPACSRVAN